MITLLDIHTHTPPADPDKAVLNLAPCKWDCRLPGFFSVGIHPWFIGEDYKSQLELLQEISVSPQIIAIGETGLDKVSSTGLELQKKVFEQQFKLAEHVRKPLVVHTVKSASEIIEYKRTFQPESPWIIHGFRGKKELAEEWIRHGFYLSLGEKFNPDALTAIPTNRLFIETDESTMPISEIYEKIAAVLEITSSVLRSIVQENIRTVFLKDKSCLFR